MEQAARCEVFGAAFSGAESRWCVPAVELGSALRVGEEGCGEGAGGGAGRKLYVILGWLLSNCFNEMECSVFSACLAETAIFFFIYNFLF